MILVQKHNVYEDRDTILIFLPKEDEADIYVVR
jgi:hypothetical protein